jgi:hypothetical protein
MRLGLRCAALCSGVSRAAQQLRQPPAPRPQLTQPHPTQAPKRPDTGYRMCRPLPRSPAEPLLTVLAGVRIIRAFLGR